MDLIGKHNIAHRLEKGGLLFAINCVASLSIFFFGYDQGLMSGVNNTPDYYETTMKFGHQDPASGAVVVDNSLLQGGIVSSNQSSSNRIIL